MHRSCRQCNAGFAITDDDLAFYQKVSPIFGGVRYDIPPPTLCPECRSRRRMSWRNERHLYPRLCTLCKRNKIAAFSPDSKTHAYCTECFYGDGWDPLSFGRDFDFSKSFADNMRSLLKEAPVMMLYQPGPNENCEYINFAGTGCRNCYLIFNSGRAEDCYHSRGLVEAKDCADILIGKGDELCYECVNCSDNYRLSYSQNCVQCSDSAFLFNCRRCKNCFGCTNLVQKEYCLFNEPCTPEEYAEAMAGLRSAARIAETDRRFDAMRRSCIHRATNSINAEACTGDYITASKNCVDCFEVTGAEDCKWLMCARFCKDSQDLFGFSYDSELLYDNIGVGYSTSTAFSFTCRSVPNSYYCLYCENAQHCFGCIGMRQAKFCILNKQYTQDEYGRAVGTIIEHMGKNGEWGEFLPMDMSLFGYNESIAQEYMPCTQEEALARGWRWSTYDSPPPQAGEAVAARDLPDGIDDVPEDFVTKAVICAATKKPFRVIKQELDLYRRLGVPLPRLHPDERHRRRMLLRNPCRVWQRPCAHCDKMMATTYAPERPETVYCEDCYAREVF